MYSNLYVKPLQSKKITITSFKAISSRHNFIFIQLLLSIIDLISQMSTEQRMKIQVQIGCKKILF